MKHLFLFRTAVIIGIAPFILSGCISIKTNPSANQPKTDLGWFVTVDNGVSWQQLAAIQSAGADRPNLAGTNITGIVRDPSDPLTFYTLTDSRGLLWSYDQMKTWQQGREFRTGKVHSLAIDPQNNCTLYLGQGRTIYKSTDCARSWQKMYFDTRSNIVFSALLVDRVNTQLVYAGNMQGEFVRSFNGGADWQTVKRFNNPVLELRSYAADPSLMYALTQSSGIYNSRDGGMEWSDWNDALKPYGGSNKYVQLALNPLDLNFILYLSDFGMLESRDGGTTWQEVQINTPRKGTKIFSVAFNPKNTDELYYTTANVFYYSKDSGATWSTSNLPTTAEPRMLFMDEENLPTLYLGTYRPAPKK